MRKKNSTDIQREGLGKQSPEETLVQLFAYGTGYRSGIATLWVSYMGKDGQQYGSSKTIHEEALEGREYTLSQSVLCPWSIHLLFTDEIYEPRKKMRSLLHIKN